MFQDVIAFAAAAVLTIFDATATYVWLRHGIAIEGNPLVSELVRGIGIELAMVVRVAWGLTLLVTLLVLATHSRVARLGLPFTAGALTTVGVVHMFGFIGHV